MSEFSKGRMSAFPSWRAPLFWRQPGVMLPVRRQVRAESSSQTDHRHSTSLPSRGTSASTVRRGACRVSDNIRSTVTSPGANGEYGLSLGVFISRTIRGDDRPRTGHSGKWSSYLSDKRRSPRGKPALDCGQEPRLIFADDVLRFRRASHDQCMPSFWRLVLHYPSHYIAFGLSCIEQAVLSRSRSLTEVVIFRHADTFAPRRGAAPSCGRTSPSPRRHPRSASSRPSRYFPYPDFTNGWARSRRPSSSM